MKFLTLEDFTDSFEVVLFPRTCRRYGHLLTGRGPFIVTGKVENDSGGYGGPGAAWTVTAASFDLGGTVDSHLFAYPFLVR